MNTSITRPLFFAALGLLLLVGGVITLGIEPDLSSPVGRTGMPAWLLVVASFGLGIGLLAAGVVGWKKRS